MKNNRKRILCCVLSFLMLFSLVPLSAFAEEQFGNSPASADIAASGPVPEADAANSGMQEESLRFEEDVPSEENTLSEETPLMEKNISFEEAIPSEEGVPSGEDGWPAEPGDSAPTDEPGGALTGEASGGADEAERENAEPGEPAPAGPSEALISLRELIASLPAADEIAGMDEEEQAKVHELVSRILDIYDALSEEEQALADLSPLKALSAASGAQPLADKEVSLNVTYSPSDLKCGVPITFTLTSSDGTGPFKYYIGSMMVKTDTGIYMEYDRTLGSSGGYTEETASRTHTYEYTFMASGTYYFDAYVMDMGSSPLANPRVRVEFTINDSGYPSVDDMVDTIYQACEAKNFATDYEKVLFYHDWLINNAEYDHSLRYSSPGGVLCRRKGTCESYYAALNILLKRSGIPCDRVYTYDHVWNLVYLDDAWVMIDATWDDTADPYLRHMYFGLTEELMTAVHGNLKYDVYQPCTSLAQHYMIRTSNPDESITKLSDPIKMEIQALPVGSHTIPASTGNNIAAAYYKTLCPLAAYYLVNCDPDLKGSGVEVSYNAEDMTYSIVKPCKVHTLEAIPGVAATCTASGLTEGKKCSVCGTVTVPQETIPALEHSLETVPGVAATCTAAGLTEGKKCSVCGTVTVPQETIPVREHTPVTDPAVKPSGLTPGLTEGSHCSVCGKTLVAQTECFSETALILPSKGLSGSALWVDGVQLPASAVTEKDGKICIELPRTDASSLVTYTYNKSSSDPHEVYPVGMKVWMLEYDGGYTAKYIPEFDNLLKYAGSSIRITGVKGIRMITGIRQDVKSALTGRGIEGYTLREYGTVLAWASEVDASSLVLGTPGAKSNFAYKRGVADPVFASGGGMTQYTNVLVGFNNDQCKADIVMRPYIVLRSAGGRDVTIYGGVVQRSIGYIAYQNRSVFSPGSGAYNYVWDIIRHVYGKKYG